MSRPTPAKFHHQMPFPSSSSSSPSSSSSRLIYRLNEPSAAADFTHPPRLDSPFQLASNATNIPAAYNYRVSKSTPARRHQRHCARIECPIPTMPHAFDGLPWISVMDIQPCKSTPPSDIADLSRLEVDPRHQRPSPSHRVGPVRRRKTSFRSNPITSSDSSSLLLEYTKLSTLSSTPPPKTPKRSQSRIAFHDLMPMLTCDIRHRAEFPGPLMP